MKHITATLIFIVISASIGLAQTQTSFTKITDGPVPNDQANSFHGSWGDFDNDRDLDLVITANPRRLYQNNANGNFTRIIALPLNIVDEGGGGNWIDLDNDGDLDLYTPREGAAANILHLNNGDGTFTKVTSGNLVESGTYSRVVRFADFDNDGWVDVFLGNDGGSSQKQANRLYFNNGDGTFTKVDMGMEIVEDRGQSTGATVGDFNDDGYMDVYVANRTPENPLYLNNGDRTFTKVTSGIIAATTANTRDADWIDIDNDQDLDLFAAGHFSSSNLLFRNNGDGTFTRITSDPVVTGITNTEGGGTWGDIDNDGDIDLVVANCGLANDLFENDGTGAFTQITTGPIVTEGVACCTGSSFADFDTDGDLDLHISRLGGGGNDFFYHNDGNSNHFINIKCTGVISNRSAIGARVYITATIGGSPVTQMREVGAYDGGSPLNIHVGLGDASTITQLEIRWPASGIVQTFNNVGVDQFIEIIESVNSVNVLDPPLPDLPVADPALITGTVFLDIDEDCSRNLPAETTVGHRIIRADDASGKANFVFSDDAGTYDFSVPEDDYEISIVPDPLTQEPASCGQEGKRYSVSATAGNTEGGNDFHLKSACGAAVNAIGVNYPDELIVCSMCCDQISPCPGFAIEYVYEFCNTGTEDIIDPQFLIELDPGATFAGVSISSNPCGLIQPCGIPLLVNEICFLHPAGVLPAGSCCEVRVLIDQIVSCNSPKAGPDNLTTSATLSGTCAGAPISATNSHSRDCSCSCDPNDKTPQPQGCGPQGNIAIDQTLDYKIRFQNIGFTPAVDVVISDQLDEDLDVTTFQVLESSHTITDIQIIPDQKAIISFLGIQLPDSISDPAGSQGFVRFTIDPKPGLPEGTEINNQAGIYFDQNEVVLTNTTLNTLREHPSPVAAFSTSHSCTSTGLVYDFTYTGGTSDGASFNWDFGPDAIPATSMDEHPTDILFANEGIHEVSLTVSRYGCSETVADAVQVMDVSCTPRSRSRSSGSSSSGDRDQWITICHYKHKSKSSKSSKSSSNSSSKSSSNSSSKSSSSDDRAPETICIPMNKLHKYLALGDCIGPCDPPAPAKRANNSPGENLETSGHTVVKIYPNPTAGQFTLYVSRGNPEHVTLINVLGESVLHHHSVVVGEQQIDLSGYPNGIYFAKVKVGTQMFIQRIVKY